MVFSHIPFREDDESRAADSHDGEASRRSVDSDDVEGHSLGTSQASQASQPSQASQASAQEQREEHEEHEEHDMDELRLGGGKYGKS